MASQTPPEDALRAGEAVARFSRDYLAGSLPPTTTSVGREEYASNLGLGADDLSKLIQDKRSIDLGQSTLEGRLWSERIVLASLLHADLMDGKLARHAQGRILRSRYLFLFRSPRHSSLRYDPVFSELERHLPVLNAPLSQKTEEIEVWFSERFEEGSLDIFDGRPSRRQVYNAFGISTRAKVPELEAPLQRWSDRILAEGYKPDPVKVRQSIANASYEENRPKTADTVQLRVRLSEQLQRDFDGGALVLMKNRDQVSRAH